VDGTTEPFTTHPECPSELRLDQLHLGELAASDSANVNAHVSGCARCKARVEFRQRGLAAFAGLDPGRMVSSIAAASPSDPVVRRPSRTRWVPIAASAAAVVLIAALVIPRETPDEIRPKGDLGLTIFRERAGKVERVIAGDKVRAKDRLRFEVSIPDKARQIMIVSVEDGGKMFTYYPSDGSERSQPPKTSGDGALEGAIELDASLASEEIHLVACTEPFRMADLALGKNELKTPPGCEETSLLVKKEGAP
jgi:hypothetical protein